MDLAYLRLAYFGFDGEVHEGQLVVHRDLADEVVAIFRALFQSRFPVEKCSSSTRTTVTTTRPWRQQDLSLQLSLRPGQAQGIFPAQPGAGHRH